MDDDAYKGGSTTGGKWGCALAAVFGMPLIGFSVLVSALGDCIPDEPCSHGLIWWLIIPSLIIAATVGLGSRAAINWFLERRRNDR